MPRSCNFLTGWKRTRAQGGLSTTCIVSQCPTTAFGVLSRFTHWHRFVKHDGAVSILRSFRGTGVARDMPRRSDSDHKLCGADVYAGTAVCGSSAESVRLGALKAYASSGRDALSIKVWLVAVRRVLQRVGPAVAGEREAGALRAGDCAGYREGHVSRDRDDRW